MSNGHRWSKWWWADHRGDPAVRMCGLAARGLWIELQALMFPSGYLLVNDKQPTARQIAGLVGAALKEIEQLLAELEAAGVFSRTAAGTIYCRRMVRDAAASDAGREHIAKRWNRGDPNSPPNRGPNREANRDPTSPPIFPPQTPPLPQKLEAEAEPPLPPMPDGIGGTRSAAVAKFGTRAAGTNPRAMNGHQKPPQFRSGAIQLVYEEGLAAAQAEQDREAQDRAEFEAFVAQKGLRYGGT
jgi:hypothetical protein